MADIWGDFDNFVAYTVPKLTVPKLRQLADSIASNGHMNLGLKSQERKSDLVDKINGALHSIRRANRSGVYVAVRRDAELLIVGKPTPLIPAPTFGGVPSSSSFAGPSRGATMGSFATAGAGGWQSQPPRFNGNAMFHGTNPNYGSQNRAATAPQLQDWKPSPLWKPLRALTGMEMLPDIASSESSHTRREKRTHFQLSNDIIDMLNKNKTEPNSRPVYSVRLFCASSEYYRPAGMAPIPGAAPINNRLIPIEYPNTPDLHVDDNAISCKERGLRGKAGSAPPFDLDKSHRGLVRIPGRMATLTMGHTGPTVSKRKEVAKRFWFQVVFCEITPIDDLLKSLEALVPTDAEVELAKLREKNDDDDIEIGPSHLSLRDPLSGMRITKPIRSSKCSHLQCFDARWWLEANRSHPQWLCPHCSKEIQIPDVICDGYFLSVLDAVPDDYDEVVLESNGDWHTADKKYGTKAWLAANGVPPPSPVITVKRQRSESFGTRSPVVAKRAAIEILSDSEDDDEPLANGRANGNGNAHAGSSSTPAPAPKQTASAVIDLTLSDSDDETAAAQTDDEMPLRFSKPVVVPTSRDVAVSHPRPAEPDNPTAFSDALRSILDSRPGNMTRPTLPPPHPSVGGRHPNHVPARPMNSVAPTHQYPRPHTQPGHVPAGALPPLAQPSRTTFPGQYRQ